VSLSLRVVLLLLALSLFGLAVNGGVVYSRLSYLWVLLIVGSWVWSRVALRGVRFYRRGRVSRGQVGQVFEEHFYIENTGRLPRVWLEVHDLSRLPGAQISHVHMLVGGRQRRFHLGRTLLIQRGVFELGPTEVTSGDPFGLFTVSHRFEPESALTVLPQMIPVDAFPEPPGLLPGGEALRRRTHHVTPNATTIREYASGDSFNRIHWPSSARRDRLMVKEFELDPLADVWLFLDAARYAQAALSQDEAPGLVEDWRELLNVPAGELTGYGRGKLRYKKDLLQPPSTEEYGVTIAASLARYYLSRKRAVGLALNGGSLDLLPPDKGGRQLNKILISLALLRAEGEIPFSALISGQIGHLPRGSTVVLITPSVEEAVAFSVDQLIRVGMRPVVVLLDAATFGGREGTDRLADGIRTLGVPLLRIANGDDLREALNSLAALRNGQRLVVETALRAV